MNSIHMNIISSGRLIGLACSGLSLMFCIAEDAPIAADKAQQPSSSRAAEEYPDPRLSLDGFKKYLQKPYPIKRVLFGKPGSEVLFKGKPLTGSIFFEGSLQPNTFYLRHLEVMSNQPPNYVSKGQIAGQSKEGMLWSVNGDAAKGKGGEIDLAMATGRGSRKISANKADGDALAAQFDLRRVANYGVGLLIPDTLTWDGNRFKAEEWGPGWPQTTNRETIEGQIVEYVGNLPRRIRIHCDAWPKSMIAAEIESIYDSKDISRWFPTDIIISAVTLSSVVPINRIKILDIEFGSAELDAYGFSPAMFVKINTNNPPNIFMTTNGVVYWVNGDRLEEIKSAGPLPTRRPYSRQLLWVVVSGLTAALFFAFWLRRAKYQQQMSTTTIL